MKADSKYTWSYPENKELSPELIQAAGSVLTAQLLFNRGIDTPEKAKSFFDLDNAEISSPYVFEHMQKAVNRIDNAIKDQEHIVIYGDFDADGITSTSLLYKTLRHLGANVSYYIPDRSEEGHGLNSASICKLISAKQAKLIITVDCGISNFAEITLAKGLGVDIIITDHHEVPEIVPPAFAIINPKTSQEHTGYRYLAGVGVAYKLAQALLEFYNKLDYIDEILYLVAIGTIADVVPLIDENRALVYKGLKVISEKRPTNIIELLQVSGYKVDNNIPADAVAFGIAPKINAIGRLADAGLAVEFLVSEDKEEIIAIAKKLNYNNRIRQQMCESTFIQANQKINTEIDLDNDKAIILADTEWHPGIIGIVASKLVEKHYRPVFLISVCKDTNEARCSARGIEGLSLYQILANMPNMFKQFGGHALAAGFVLDLNKMNMNKFKSSLLTVVEGECLDTEVFKPKLKIDETIEPKELTIDLIEELNKLAPFGESNPSPVISISNLIIRDYKTIGASKNHLKIFLEDEDDNLFEAVWWQKSGLDFEVSEKVNVAFTPEINTFGGERRIQLVIKDIQSAKHSESKTISKQDSIQAQDISKNTTVFIPKLIDHRKKTRADRIFSSYFKTTKENALIFAENSTTLEVLNKDPILKPRIFNRLNMSKTDQLMLFDLPPDLSVLSKLIGDSGAKIIHLIGKNYEEEPKTIINKLSGMLKYAYNNKNGEVNVNNIASVLSTSVLVINSCIELLDKANIINISSKISELIKFEFLGSCNLTSMITLEEFNYFADNIKKTQEFRYKLATLEINQISKIYENTCV